MDNIKHFKILFLTFSSLSAIFFLLGEKDLAIMDAILATLFAALFIKNVKEQEQKDNKEEQIKKG